MSNEPQELTLYPVPVGAIIPKGTSFFYRLVGDTKLLISEAQYDFIQRPVAIPRWTMEPIELPDTWSDLVSQVEEAEEVILKDGIALIPQDDYFKKDAAEDLLRRLAEYMRMREGVNSGKPNQFNLGAAKVNREVAEIIEEWMKSGYLPGWLRR